jgi:hypothetical protein
MERGHYVLQDGKISEERVHLKGSANAQFGNFVGLMAGYIGPIKDHLTSGRREYPGNQIKEGGLAGPVRANEAHYLPFIDIHVKLVDRRQTAKSFG